MAKANKKTSKQAAHEIVIAQMGLVEYGREAMIEYGHYTLEQRAIADFRDGLKPVHRRILWAAHELNLRAARDVPMKSAKVVGDAMGNYHPHGDAALYDALVNMAWTSQGLMYPSGNFGTLIDRPAAMRYTETRLTHYADAVFFDRDLLNVQERSINYDGSRREPVILPAMLPNLLLNGSYGIATGARAAICAFEAEGVIKLTKLAIAGKEISAKTCLKNMVPVTAPREGGSAYLAEPEYEAELLRFFKTGYGSVYWIPEAEIDVKSRSITVTGFAPSVTGNLSTILAKLEDDEEIQSVTDDSDIDPVTKTPSLAYTITLRRNVPADRVEDALLEVQELFEVSQPLMMLVGTRKLNEDELTSAKPDMMNMPDFYAAWAEWRIMMERLSIKFQIERIEEKLARDELLLLAVINREVIIKALDREDTEKFLAKALKITEEQVNVILSLQVRQLKRLEESPIRDRIKQHKTNIKNLKADHKDPVKRIHASIDLAAKATL